MYCAKNKETVLAAIENLIDIPTKKQLPLIIGIDGPCASGKTCLAKDLALRVNASVIHLDDYFLQPHQRTKERYETPGENLDWERLVEEVLNPVSHHLPVMSAKFDCTTQSLSEKKRIDVKNVLILEGSYCFHPSILPYLDLKIFLTIDSLHQKERLLKRESSESYESFINRWIVLEQKYFDYCKPEEQADLIV